MISSAGVYRGVNRQRSLNANQTQPVQSITEYDSETLDRYTKVVQKSNATIRDMIGGDLAKVVHIINPQAYWAEGVYMFRA